MTTFPDRQLDRPLAFFWELVTLKDNATIEL